MFGGGSFAKVSAYVDDRVLAAGVAETVTKPTGTPAQTYNTCVITSNADVWVRRGGTAAVPAADVTDGTGSALLPLGVPHVMDFRDDDGTILASFSIICTGVALVSMQWYR